MKKILYFGLIVLLLVGGYYMLKKDTLTKEQQDNVVRWIARGYNVKSVEFTNFSKNTSTGSYLLSIKVNNDEKLGTVLPTYNLDIFNSSVGRVGLGPVNEFESIKRVDLIDKADEVDIKGIKIIYLGEQLWK